MNEDLVITEELQRGGRGYLEEPDWQGSWWVREYDLPRLCVYIRQWRGTRTQQSTTGAYYIVSIPRYWMLWWKVWWFRRSGGSLPRARVRR